MSKWVISNNNKELTHYASPYYDPVKAHEYYMKHRELKGYKNRSTKGLDQEARDELKSVKSTRKDLQNMMFEGYDTNRNSYISYFKRLKDSKSKIEKAKRDSQLEKETSTLKSSVESLKKQLEGMSSFQKAKNKDRIKDEINKLREKSKAAKLVIKEASKKTMENIRTENRKSSANARLDNKIKKVDYRLGEKRVIDAHIDRLFNESEARRAAKKRSR